MKFYYTIQSKIRNRLSSLLQNRILFFLFEIILLFKYYQFLFLSKIYSYDKKYFQEIDHIKKLVNSPGKEKNIAIAFSGGSGDIAVSKDLIHGIIKKLKENGYTIHFIGLSKYKHIILLMADELGIEKLHYTDDNLLYQLYSDDDIKKYSNFNGDLINFSKIYYLAHSYTFLYDIKNFNSKGILDVISNDLEILSFYNKDFSVKNSLDNILNTVSFDIKKIDYILKKYSLENGKIRLCNFENFTFKLLVKDGIVFNDYLEYIKGKNDKYVINSVYAKESHIESEQIYVTTLSFFEVLYLAKEDKIQEFISERNGLNDIFTIWFSNIPQTILYPRYFVYGLDIGIGWLSFGKVSIKEYFSLKKFLSNGNNNILKEINRSLDF